MMYVAAEQLVTFLVCLYTIQDSGSRLLSNNSAYQFKPSVSVIECVL